MFGIGYGLGVQTLILTPQVVLKGGDIALGTSLIIFIQTLSSAIFLCIAQSVFQTSFVKDVEERIPGVNFTALIDAGASDLRQVTAELYPDDVSQVIDAYNDALKDNFLIAIVMVTVCIFGVVFMEWKSVKKEKQSEQVESEKQDA
jgi:hypothetical protein